MKKLVVLALLLIGTSAHASAQMAEAVSSKRLNFAYTYGNPDYVDLSSLGPHVFAAGVDNQMVKARNMKSFAINYRGWRLLDEFIVDPEFFWELDPIALKGKIRTVNYEKIAKYPSLAKRYKAIKPVGVNYIVCLNLYSTVELAVSTLATHQVCFRAQSYQMFWGASRSGRPASYPGALLGWKEGVSTASAGTRFTASDNSDVNRLKALVSRFEKVSAYTGLATNTWLDIRWPDDAIDKIYEDFEEYEKEGKDLEKEYKEAKEEPKTAKRAQPLAADDEMAQPFEDSPKTAKVFNENGVAGLITPNGKKVFSSTNGYKPFELDNEGRFFAFPGDRNGLNSDQILNAAGKVVKFDGHAAAAHIKRNNDGTFTAYVRTGGPVAYRTAKCYSIWARLAIYYTPEEFSAFQASDRQPRKPPVPSTSNATAGSNVYEIGADSRNFYEFRPVLQYLLDAKMKVITKGEAYELSSVPEECS